MSGLFNKILFWKNADRLGPDIPYTHWRLHFKKLMTPLCKQKFKHFSESAEFRPGAYAVACTRISLGDRVVIRPGCMLFADPRLNGAGITIEDGVMLGSAVHIYVHNHRYDDISLPIIDQGHYPSEPVVLKSGCWIGANAIILPGVTVGQNAVVGANSVVTRDIPAYTVYAGNPARLIRSLSS
ncbi:MAG: acyltransferase [Halopseudomonas sp.]